MAPVLAQCQFLISLQGDIQTSTMLALIASEELKVTKRRVLRLLDSYIGSVPSFHFHYSLLSQ